MTFLFRLDACVSWWGNEGFSHSMCLCPHTQAISPLSFFVLVDSIVLMASDLTTCYVLFSEIIYFFLKLSAFVCALDRKERGGWLVGELVTAGGMYVFVCMCLYWCILSPHANMQTHTVITHSVL